MSDVDLLDASADAFEGAGYVTAADEDEGEDVDAATGLLSGGVEDADDAWNVDEDSDWEPTSDDG